MLCKRARSVLKSHRGLRFIRAPNTSSLQRALRAYEIIMTDNAAQFDFKSTRSNGLVNGRTSAWSHLFDLLIWDSYSASFSARELRRIARHFERTILVLGYFLFLDPHVFRFRWCHVKWRWIFYSFSSVDLVPFFLGMQKWTWKSSESELHVLPVRSKKLKVVENAREISFFSLGSLVASKALSGMEEKKVWEFPREAKMRSFFRGQLGPFKKFVVAPCIVQMSQIDCKCDPCTPHYDAPREWRKKSPKSCMLDSYERVNVGSTKVICFVASFSPPFPSFSPLLRAWYEFMEMGPMKGA